MRADTHAGAASGVEMHERGIRVLLFSLLALFLIVDVFDVRLSLGVGLTVENALLYVLAGGILFRLVLQRRFVFQGRALHVCFAILILYAIVSFLGAAFVVDYPRYNVLRFGLALKSRLLDYATYFIVFFYGLRESRNAHAMLKVLLLAACIGSVIAFLNVLGVAQIGVVGENEDYRLEGLMGEPNQDAAFLCLIIPGVVAAMISAKSVWRGVWFAALLGVFGAFLLTASRGGFLGLIVSSIWGAFLFRRHLPLRRIIAFAGWAAAVAMAALIALSARYGSLLYRRVIEDSASTDIASASSGRLEMWSNALATMANTPLTLLTGFGWEVYWLMPFRYAPHNTYLGLYFNLGLLGVVSWFALLALLVREMRAAAPLAAPAYRSALIAFAFGVLGIAIATFFVDLSRPWVWFWAYAGLVMRIAVNARAKDRSRAAEDAMVAPPSASRRDPFGWAGSAQP